MRAEYPPINESAHQGAGDGRRDTTRNPCNDSLKDLLKSAATPVMLLGIGNTLKGDDGLGPKLCERLLGKITADVIDAGTVPENYIGQIVKKAPKTLLIVDAVDLGEAAGTVKLLRPEQLQQFALSTHCLSPHLFGQLVSSEIDVKILFIAVQPAQLTLGRGLSEPAARAVESIAQDIEQTLISNR